MKDLSIDIETYSPVDLPSCGVYRYAAHPQFRILLLAYSVDFGPVQVVDLAQGEPLPLPVRDALTNPAVAKHAFNANFERVCLSRLLGLPMEQFLNPTNWRCTMVAAARCGWPLSLAQCAQVLQLEHGKMEEGRDLIRLFSCANSKGERNLPECFPQEWTLFKQYCQRDVEVEMDICRRASSIEQPHWEQVLYELDQTISDRGVAISPTLASNAERFSQTEVEQLVEQMKLITRLPNPLSDAQLKPWLAAETGLPITSLGKEAVAAIEAQVEPASPAAQVLALRRLAKKTSCAKYTKMLDAAGEDFRVRGLLQYYGANRTGRWAGRLVQMQNLPQNHIEDLELARELLLKGDLGLFRQQFPQVTQTLSELIRTAFCAPQGRTFLVCDFNAIEARVLAWLAGEEWVLRVFRQGGDIYCATAAQMFGVPVEKDGANSHLRARGKVATLALGYGGGVKALEAVGGAKLGLSSTDMCDTVSRWRRANPAITAFWKLVQKAAERTICRKESTTLANGLTFAMEGDSLCIQLPSKRKLVYPKARMEYVKKKFGIPSARPVLAIVYNGVNQTTKKWETIETYGGKLTENIVQAVARDILAAALFRAHNQGLNVVFHVHDEIIVEATPGQHLAQLVDLFSQPIPWAPGLPLKGEGYETPFYRKS